MKQFPLYDFKNRAQFVPQIAHGGVRSLKRRKTKRPFFESSPMVLRLFSSRAKGAWSLTHRKNRSRVTSMIYSYANRYGVHVYQANQQHQEIVLLVKAKDRKALADFLRVLAGRVAVILTGAKKGVKKIGKFWNFLTWSKLVNWGKEFFVLARFIKNGLSHSQDLKLENKGESLLDWWDLATDPPR